MAEGRVVDLSLVPDQRTHPVELIALTTPTPGMSKEIVVDHYPDHLAPHGPEVQELVDQYLKPHKKPGTFFNGEYANVEAIEITHQLTIKTGVANSFPYMASAWYHRNNTGANPIHPLAVQTVVFDEEKRNTILIERRPADIIDHPSRLSVLGGTLQPGEDPRVGTCRCLAKWKISMDPSQLTPLALTHEPAGRIYCLVFTAKMPGSQIAEVMRNMSEKRYMWAEPIAGSIINRRGVRYNLLYDHLNIHKWNPLGFLAFTCGTFMRWGEGEQKVREFLDLVYSQLKEWPYQYTFPMEKYLPAEQQGA